MKDLATECVELLKRGVVKVTLGGRQGPYKSREAELNYDPNNTPATQKKYRDAYKKKRES